MQDSFGIATLEQQVLEISFHHVQIGVVQKIVNGNIQFFGCPDPASGLKKRIIGLCHARQEQGVVKVSAFPPREQGRTWFMSIIGCNNGSIV